MIKTCLTYMLECKRKPYMLAILYHNQRAYYHMYTTLHPPHIPWSNHVYTNHAYTYEYTSTAREHRAYVKKITATQKISYKQLTLICET